MRPDQGTPRPSQTPVRARADGHASASGRAGSRADRLVRPPVSALDPRIAEALARLPEYLGAHVVLSLSALGLGLALSLPLALLAVRSPRLRWALLTAASVIQTIPSLALLALFYPLLLALSLLTKAMTGAQFSALGF